MWDHPAFYHARRMRVVYSLSAQATLPELLAVCADRGIPVIRGPLKTPGLYVNSPKTGPLILLAYRVRPWVLAHELFHALMTDACDHGVVYHYYEEGGDVEQAAQDFACLLCGTDEERRARRLV